MAADLTQSLSAEAATDAKSGMRRRSREKSKCKRSLAWLSG